MDNYIEINLGSSFLLNAGILGLLKLLDTAEARENSDYIIEDQRILVHKNFILNNDLSDLYIKTMFNNFKDNTKFKHILDKKSIVDGIFNKSTQDKDDEKIVKDIFIEFTEMLGKNSFKSGYEIINNMPGVTNISLDEVKKLKKEKDIKLAREIYNNLYSILQQPQVQEILVMKELMYTKINMFYENTSFFLPANLKKSIKETYYKDFVLPLVEEINTTKKKTKRCIECSHLSVFNKSISFMSDTTDDIARKKSHYWNYKPDAFVCPMCAFLYTLAPLGFEFCGSDAVFINNNSSIVNMRRLMNTYTNKKSDEGNSSLSKLYRIFTTEGIEMIKSGLSNIQVIVRKQKNSHFELNIISKDIISGLNSGIPYLKNIEKKYIKTDKDYKSVYDEVMQIILTRTSLYPIIHKLLKYELQENRNTNYLTNILRLQIIFNGGIEMGQLQKKVTVAFEVGKKMREELTRDIKQDKDKDNSLRGIVYKLSNTLSVKNREQFLDTIIRIYSGKGQPVPSVFKDCYDSDEALQAIGYAFILGLKYVKYEKNDEGVR